MRAHLAQNHPASEGTPSEANSTRPVSDQSAIDFNSPRNIAMQTQTTPKQTATPTTALTDLKKLRLEVNYGAIFGVKKLLTNVLVGKPKKPQFFRTHESDDMTFPAMILENKESRESYVVVPDVAQEISELVRPVMLHAAIDRQNNVSLIPVPLPGEDGTRNPWHESLAQAVEHAKLKWIRIAANMHVGAYDVYEAEGELPDPEWPAHDIDELVQVAFRGKIITSLDHPIVQSLLGKI
jgi:hypothetical protein